MQGREGATGIKVPVLFVLHTDDFDLLSVRTGCILESRVGWTQLITTDTTRSWRITMIETVYTLLKIGGCVMGYEVFRWGVLSLVETFV